MYNTAITTGIFVNSNGESIQKNDGASAKASLTTSSQFINKLHEVVKVSIKEELENQDFIFEDDFKIHPPLNESRPEQVMYGYLKKKKQDVVFLFEDKEDETIQKGALRGDIDSVGSKATDTSIILGVRSSLSSLDKNFDTLIERAYAEALNVRLRNPLVVMGEIFLLPVKEYDQNEMKNNIVAFNSSFTKIKKYMSVFKSISGRNKHTIRADYYKYERSCLLIVDFDQSPIKIYTTLQELKNDNVVPRNFRINYSKLSPVNFSTDLVNIYKMRHEV